MVISNSELTLGNESMKSFIVSVCLHVPLFLPLDDIIRINL